MSSMFQAKHGGRGREVQRCLMYDSWFLLWPQLTGEAVVQHSTPGIQRKAVRLLWTKKVWFELGLEGTSLETKGRAWFSRLNKVHTKKQVGWKNNGEKIVLFHWRVAMCVHVCRVTGGCWWGDETWQGNWKFQVKDLSIWIKRLKFIPWPTWIGIFVYLLC